MWIKSERVPYARVAVQKSLTGYNLRKQLSNVPPVEKRLPSEPVFGMSVPIFGTVVSFYFHDFQCHSWLKVGKMQMLI